MAAVVLVASSTPLAAQAPDRAIEFDDLGLTESARPGTRGAALPALVAAANDATALIYNPAGLVRVRRPHGMLALANGNSRLQLDYGTGPAGERVSSSHLDFAGIAFPLPVLRGSLVPALSIHRAFSSARDLAYTRDNTRDGRSENYSLQQTGATYAYTLGVASDLSSTLSVGASVFVLDGRVDALRQYDWQPLVTNPSAHHFVLEDTEAGVSGYGANIGLQLFLNERIQIGVRFATPTVVKLHATGVREETIQIVNDVGSYQRADTDNSTEYILPYRVDTGVAIPLGLFYVTAEARFANWSNAAIDGQHVLTQQSDPVLRRVVTLAAGIEWSVATLPLRVRAGIEHSPSPLAYLQTDRIDNDALEPLTSQSGRLRLSAGAAVLVRERITLDAAYSHSSGTRSAPTVSDDYSAAQVSLQGSYWF
ncbi:MAG TPA: outer membrane protein transport protein [Candidatus Krumholzibacteria bacterium]|nr:outer membrane protein transport protein [Candidatus Krumholzibacteria bacterium]